ncbi:MAG: 3-phenylpropionate MFS transporter [Bacillus sp. (in: firmicutes)]
MNNQRWMSLNFFTFFFTWGIFLPYWTGWLVEAKGLTVAEASLIMSLGLVARGAATLFGFPLASRIWSTKGVINLLTLGAFTSVLLYIPAGNFPSLLAVTLLFNLFYPSLMPALDSTAGVLVQHGGLHYGKSRSYGSMGFIISVFILSMVTGAFGDAAILWLMIICLAAMVLLGRMPAPDILLAQPEHSGHRDKPSIKSLFKTRGFLTVLAVVVLLQASHASYYNYGYIYLQDLGVSKYYIGAIINIGVLFEIIYFAKADGWFGKWKPESLLVLAGAGATIRWLLVYLFPNVWIFVLSQTLHALSFGVAHYAFILYLSRNLPKGQIPQAQGLYSALALSWGTAVLTLFGGYLYDMTPALAFLGMAVFTLPATVLAVRIKHQAEATI